MITSTNRAALGRLTRVDLRQAWVSESRDFTPWLAQAENMELLGDTVNLSLEVVSREERVEEFRADIVCRDIANDRVVLIENQLEPTDHPHLGQLLTYAAGLQAVTIIWVAYQIRAEHRAAIDWLNEIT